jgi:hypothetical protein
MAGFSSWQVRLQMCLKFCMVKIANRTRAQTRSTITPAPHWEPPICSLLVRASPYSRGSQLGGDGKFSKSTVFLSKIAFPGRKSQIADRKIADKLYCKSYENFQSPGFPHNFSQNYPQNSNMGCIDASQRQLQSVIKIRV